MNKIIELNKFTHKKELIQLNKKINHERENADFEAEIQISISSYLRGIYENHKIVSFIFIYKSRILNFGTDKAYQGKGYGSQLLKQAQNDFDYLKLEVDPKNINALNLYQKHHFMTTDIYPSNQFLVMEWSKDEHKMQEMMRKHQRFMVK